MFYVEFPEKFVLKRILTGKKEFNNIIIVTPSCILIKDWEFNLTVVNSADNSRTDYKACEILNLMHEWSPPSMSGGLYFLNCTVILKCDGYFLGLIDIDKFSSKWSYIQDWEDFPRSDLQRIKNKDFVRASRNRGFDSYFSISCHYYFDCNRMDYNKEGTDDAFLCHGFSKDGRYMVSLTKLGKCPSDLKWFSLYKNGILVSEKSISVQSSIELEGLPFKDVVERLFNVNITK